MEVEIMNGSPTFADKMFLCLEHVSKHVSFYGPIQAFI